MNRAIPLSVITGFDVKLMSVIISPYVLTYPLVSVIILLIVSFAMLGTELLIAFSI